MTKKTQKEMSPEEILKTKERIASLLAEAERLEKVAEAIESDAEVTA